MVQVKLHKDVDFRWGKVLFCAMKRMKESGDKGFSGQFVQYCNKKSIFELMDEFSFSSSGWQPKALPWSMLQ